MPIFLLVGFSFKQLIIQFEMEERLEKLNQKEIIIPQTELNWKKKGREAYINGHLFDVSSYSINNGLVTLKGLFDFEEEKIIDAINNIATTRSKQETSIISISLLFMSVVFFNDINNSVFCPVKDLKSSHLANYANNYILILQHYILKPPQLV